MYLIKDAIEYKEIRNAAWLFIIKNGVAALPLDVESIANNNGWLLIEVESNLELVKAIDKRELYLICEAFTCIYKNQVFIFYKKPQNKKRWLFSVAHEFGHIALFHFQNLTALEYEKEANMFAARILMPMSVLKECGALTAAEISKVCGTSIAASERRATRLQMLIQRKKFYTSPLERKVIKQFEKFIKQKRN